MSELMGDRGILEVEALPFWHGPIKVWPLTGGHNNRNYGVQQADGQRFAVRLGQDMPQHGVMRFNEQAAARAAAKAGISPKIFYTAPGVLVSRLLPGRSLTPEEVRLPHNLPRIVALMKRCHAAMAGHLRGPLLAFWPCHVNRCYLDTLQQAHARLTPELPRLLTLNAALELRIGRPHMVYTHNDLLAANIFDDGARLWLLDWDFGGYNAPLFDLANLSSNNGFFPADDALLLEDYFGAPPQAPTHEKFRAYKCLSLLREALWSAVSELSPAHDFDYAAYTADNLLRLDVAVAELG